ncbi:response regulator transcription factor [Parahaliea mediterranea]|uniref:Response regulator transcription factor n=1 Tax=Parahaliea mediterranea TaxID=651086 RepID=A0A939DDF5_9GAMM|nr:winged helix-turn-helix domain-containing protein [Parahaliea mediterranea]MBN7796131.1 response regulator transcription factor [Parahaliea mediterranea]
MAGSGAFRVIIVDDDADFRNEISLLLETTGIASEAGTVSGKWWERLGRGRKVDIVLLGAGALGDRLFSTLRTFAHRSRVGVIALIDDCDHTTKVRALLSGADVCLSKPLCMPEVMANIRALVRRMQKLSVDGGRRDAWRLGHDGWLLVSPDGSVFRLTAKERDFMQGIEHLSRIDRIVSREDLVAYLGEDVRLYDPHTLEAVLSRLRAKVGRDFPLKTIRGVGYRFLGRLHSED